MCSEEKKCMEKEKTGCKCGHSHFTKAKLQCKRLGKQKAVVDVGLGDGWDKSSIKFLIPAF